MRLILILVLTLLSSHAFATLCLLSVTDKKTNDRLTIPLMRVDTRDFSDFTMLNGKLDGFSATYISDEEGTELSIADANGNLSKTSVANRNVQVSAKSFPVSGYKFAVLECAPSSEKENGGAVINLKSQ